MRTYDYFTNVVEDVKQYIADNKIEINADNRDEVEEQLNEDLWIEDSVTGNGSGSYTFNNWQAEEYLCHNYNLLAEAVVELGGDMSEAIERGAEYCDVTIRCYLLGQAISQAVEDICE